MAEEREWRACASCKQVRVLRGRHSTPLFVGASVRSLLSLVTRTTSHAPTTLHLVFTRTTSLCGVSVVHQARVLGLEPVEPSVCPYPRNYEREREEENEGTHPATWSCPSSSYLCKRILQYDATKHCLTSRYLFVVWRRLNPSVCSVGWQNVATLIYLKC